MLNLGIALWSAIGAGLVVGAGVPYSSKKKAHKADIFEHSSKLDSPKGDAIRDWFESIDGKSTLVENNETSAMATKPWKALSPAEKQLVNHEFKELQRGQNADRLAIAA